MSPSTILIVEDEAIVALDLRLQLQELGYQVVGVAASGEQALALAERLSPQLVLMDVRLQGPMDGIATAQALQGQHRVPLIYLTSHSDTDTVQRAARTGPYGYLTKPYQIKELRAGIEVALTKARMERQLREADGWFAHTLRCVSDGVVVTEADGRVRFINPAAETLTGWTLDEAAGRAVNEVVTVQAGRPDQRAWASAQALVTEVQHTGRPAPQDHGVAVLARQHGQRLLDIAAGPVTDDQGQHLGAVLVLRDAEARIAQEAKLRASESLFRNAFEFAPLGMALVSLSGQMLLVNDALCQMLKLSRDALQQAHHDALTVPDDLPHERQRLQELSTPLAGVVQFEKRYLRGAGLGPVWALVSVSAIHEGGLAACHLYQVHDLSDQKAAAEHLAALADERLRRVASESAISGRSDFLNRVSHEMRTPLNAVIGFAQLLQLQKATPSSEMVGRYAGHIHLAGQHLLALVTDLLDLNRAAEGQLQLRLLPTPLMATVAAAVRMVRFEADAQGVGVELPTEDGPQVLAEPQRLRQVLINLLSNAIKYNRNGGSVSLHLAPADGTMARLTVQDTGIGLSEDQVQRLFQPFERAGAERTAVPGVGLGLVIARTLMIEMGGDLVLQSQPGAGTTVTLSLPLAAD